MNHRRATEDDLDLLAEWNHQLISDEGHGNSMTIPQLRERMQDWLAGEYKGLIFYNASDPVAYAVYREAAKEVCLRQFFVIRSARHQGIGREAANVLQKQIWPPDKRLLVEVLTANVSAIAFWRSVGYSDYCLTLEITPKKAKKPDFARGG